MSKKPKKKRAEVPAAEQHPTGRPRLVAAVLVACAVLTAGFAATRFEPVRRAVGMRPLLAPTAQPQASLQRSKEYIYAGGRLVATEEPTPTPAPTPAGPPPENVVATATSSAGVELTWDAPVTTATVLNYVIERRSSLRGGLVEIPTGDNSRVFSDSTEPGDFAYLYRVKAVYSGGYSDYGNYDLATTIPFTDKSLKGAVIKATHLTELRRAVRAVRTLAGKGERIWSHPDPVSSPPAQRRVIYLADVADLRSQIDEALTGLDSELGVQVFYQPYPEIPVLADKAVVHSEHFEQIRARVR